MILTTECAPKLSLLIVKKKIKKFQMILGIGNSFENQILVPFKNCLSFICKSQ